MIIWFFVLSATVINGQECSYQLTGHIQDADTRENLAGATITLIDIHHSFITDENGDFKYANICPGSYVMEISHAGCETIRRTIVISKNTHIDISLPHLRNNLSEIIVTGEKVVQTTGFTRHVDAKDIVASQGFTIADALGKINGVNILQTGSTIAKPVVHGLHSIRVLTINNGIRQEGQQWGNEHAPEIDTYIADKLSVIKGVDELKYGSDAIGGVVLVDPRQLRTKPGRQAEINTAYFTNNNQYVVSGIYEEQLTNLPSLTYRVQGTFKKGGNIKTPLYSLNNTGVDEKNFSLAANWKKKNYQIQTYFSQFQTSIGIFPYAHVGNISDLTERIASAKPDEVFLGERTYKIERPRQEAMHRLFKIKSVFNFNEHKINITLGGQNNHRSEFDVVRNAGSKGPQISLALTTFSEEITYEHPTFRHFSGVIGINMVQQNNSYSGRYLVPNYRANGYGAFWIEKWKREKLDIEAGIRFDNKNINTSRLQYGGQVTDHDFHFSTLAASLNTGYALAPGIKINGTLTVSSRAPHVNELLSGGIHQAAGGYAFLQGNINLKTEKSVNLGLGFTYTNRRKNISIEANAYSNRINDFIYTQPKPNEPVLTVTGAAPQIVYEQTDAQLTGADVTVVYQVMKSLQVTSSVSVLRARNKQLKDWLILMPADRWRNEIGYSFKDKGVFTDTYISAEYLSVFTPRVPSDINGKQDYKEAPGAYGLLNVNASSTLTVFNHPVTLGFSVRNTLNTAYREYMNLFRYYADEIGRNVIVRLKVPFDDLFSK